MVLENPSALVNKELHPRVGNLTGISGQSELLQVTTVEPG